MALWMRCSSRKGFSEGADGSLTEKDATVNDSTFHPHSKAYLLPWPTCLTPKLAMIGVIKKKKSGH